MLTIKYYVDRAAVYIKQEPHHLAVTEPTWLMQWSVVVPGQAKLCVEHPPGGHALPWWFVDVRVEVSAHEPYRGAAWVQQLELAVVAASVHRGVVAYCHLHRGLDVVGHNVVPMALARGDRPLLAEVDTTQPWCRRLAERVLSAGLATAALRISDR
jgi:hypothetical protein